MEAKLLEGKQKRLYTALFFASVCIIGVFSLAFMNLKYDSLSRYPYTDQNSRALIREYLNDEEIEYIIEYSIAPNMFIAYIQEDGFNIYHAAEYKKLSQYQWQAPPDEIVKMVEQTRDVMNVDTLATYLINYSYDEIYDFMVNGDPYNDQSVLVMNPGDVDVFLDPTHTVNRRVPLYLQELVENVPTKDNKKIEVDVALQQPLTDLCNQIAHDLNSTQACGGLRIDQGYIDYDTQKEIYDSVVAEYGNQASTIASYPGHSEHQLGYSIDFSVEGVLEDSFALTQQAQWLEKNAYLFGFVQTYTSEDVEATGQIAQPWHYRFVSPSLSQQLHEEKKTFVQYALGKE